MINFTWNVFRQTGSIDTYLLFKELERQNEEQSEVIKDEYEEVEFSHKLIILPSYWSG